MLKFTKAVQVSANRDLRGLKIIWPWSAADMRLPSSKAVSQQRSINLAISARGLAALHAIDPAATQRFLKTVIPMKGRMIHGTDGTLHGQAYDRDGQVCVCLLVARCAVCCSLLIPLFYIPVHKFDRPGLVKRGSPGRGVRCSEYPAVF